MLQSNINQGAWRKAVRIQGLDFLFRLQQSIENHKTLTHIQHPIQAVTDPPLLTFPQLRSRCSVGMEIPGMAVLHEPGTLVSPNIRFY